MALSFEQSLQVPCKINEHCLILKSEEKGTAIIITSNKIFNDH